MYTAWKVSVFGVILHNIFLRSDWMRENADQNNSEYGHFLRSGIIQICNFCSAKYSKEKFDKYDIFVY